MSKQMYIYVFGAGGNFKKLLMLLCVQTLENIVQSELCLLMI